VAGTGQPCGFALFGPHASGVVARRLGSRRAVVRPPCRTFESVRIVRDESVGTLHRWAGMDCRHRDVPARVPRSVARPAGPAPLAPGDSEPCARDSDSRLLAGGTVGGALVALRPRGRQHSSREARRGDEHRGPNSWANCEARAPSKSGATSGSSESSFVTRGSMVPRTSCLTAVSADATLANTFAAWSHEAARTAARARHAARRASSRSSSSRSRALVAQTEEV
jgi:hypothetical protein